MVDDYAWLSDREAAQTRAYLEAERAYYDAQTVAARPLQRQLFAEMSRRTPAAERSVSWRRGTFSYFTLTAKGMEYERFCRSAGEGPPETLLDLNDCAAPGGFVGLGVREVSPDGRLLAYSVDSAGDEVYTLRFRDLTTGVDRVDELPRTYYGGAWSADSSTFFYVVHDAAHRPHQLWRHRLGSPPDADVLVLQEDDLRFGLSVRASRSGELVLIQLRSRDTSEVWLVPTERPDAPAVLVEARRSGVEYAVDHVRGPAGGHLVIVTNDGAAEFRLVQAPVAAPERRSWVGLGTPAPGERILQVDAFAAGLVLSLRRSGAPLLQVLDHDGTLRHELHPPSPAASLHLARNEEYDAPAVTVAVESLVEPAVWSDVDLVTGRWTRRHHREVPAHEPAEYLTERRWAQAPDGVPVPVTLTRRADVALDGTAPCLLHGYGAYEVSLDPEFDPALPSLLDRGAVYAVAHVRGGGECGRRWWLHGRLAHKRNTFSDYLAVARWLGAAELVDPTRIATRGLSAGGLLQGAVFSMEPSHWCGVVAEVPFVDVVNTMLDPSVPLTVAEWDEWGDPHQPEQYGWLRGYAPYENVPEGPRPPLLVTGAVHDPRVLVHEPAKWVAKLRATDTTSSRLLFRVELGSGAHASAGGRYANQRYEAEVYAFILDVLGRTADPPADSSAADRDGRTTIRLQSGRDL